MLDGGRISIHLGAYVSGFVASSGGTVVEWNEAVISGLQTQSGAIAIHDDEVFSRS